MRTLLITNKPFLPAVDGGTAASESFVKQLNNEGFDIKYFTFSSEKHPFNESLFKTDEWDALNVNHFPIRLKPSVTGAIKALITGKSYQMSRFTSNEMLQKFKQTIHQDKFDLIIFDSLYSAQMIEEFKKLSPHSKIVIRMHNVESKLTNQKVELEKNWLKRKYLSILAKQLEKREKSILNECNLVLSISEDDSKTYSKWAKTKIVTLPYFPIKVTNKWSDTPNSFMHFGAMNWQPNVLAYENLCNKLFPEILNACPDSILKVAGSFMESIPESSNSKIKHLGFIEDKFEFLASNGILLAPIENGSGVRIKIIDALSIGVPVITTIVGAQGIPVHNNEGLIICKSNEEFIEKSIELALNKEKRLELSKKAIEFYQKWYSSFSLKKLILENVE